MSSHGTTSTSSSTWLVGRPTSQPVNHFQSSPVAGLHTGMSRSLTSMPAYCTQGYAKPSSSRSDPRKAPRHNGLHYPPLLEMAEERREVSRSRNPDSTDSRTLMQACENRRLPRPQRSTKLPAHIHARQLLQCGSVSCQTGNGARKSRPGSIIPEWPKPHLNDLSWVVTRFQHTG